MNMSAVKTMCFTGILSVSLLVATSAFAEGWRVGIGPAYRTGMRLSIHGPSYAPGFAPAIAGRSSSSVEHNPGSPVVDDLSQFADRAFDDGFVYRDAATVDFGGDTWYWGYDRASQFDAASETLSFHRRLDDASARSSSVETATRIPQNDRIDIDDDLSAWGIGLQAARQFLANERFALDLQVGFNGFWNISHSSSARTFEQQTSTRRTTSTDLYTRTAVYEYDTLGVIPPDAPYAGTYDGPGPLLPNLPSALSTNVVLQQSSVSSASTSSHRLGNNIRHEIDIDLQELSLGPRLACAPCKRVSLALIPALTLSRVGIDARRTETLERTEGGSTRIVESWADSHDADEWLWGASFQAAAAIDIAKGWFVEAAGGYDWAFNPVRASLGPSTLVFDPSGFTLSARVGRAF